MNKDILKNIKKFEHLVICNMGVKSMPNFPNVTTTQIAIMEYIINSPSKCALQKEFEKVLGLSRATVSSVLITMEKNGLIIRIVDNNDTRTKKIILSNNAQKVLLNAKEKFKIIEDKCIKGIDEKDLNIFMSVLSKMNDNLKEEKDEKII